MSEGTARSGLCGFIALATAALLTFGATSAAALAQDDPTSTSPAPTSQPAPPPSDEPPPAKQTSVSGVVHADKNRDGKQDPGEAIEGGSVTLVRDRGAQGVTYKSTSGPDGRFNFRDIQPGLYEALYDLPGGWVVHRVDDSQFHVIVNQPVELTARAERPYSEQLAVTVVLDRDSYQYPANAKIEVSLTNISDRVLENVVAHCASSSVENGLGGGWAWQELFSRGVTLAAGQQRTITITEAIPAASRRHGLVTLDCHFGPVASLNTDGPVVHLTAPVNGVPGGYTMVIGEDRNADSRIDGDEAVRDTKIVLLNPATGAQVAQGTSGADGKIVFGGLPVGDYRATIVGPWAFTDAGGSLVRVVEGGDVGYRFLKRASPAKLRGTVKLDKERYESHETVRFDLTVTNDGGQTAERVRLLNSVDAVAVPDEQWGDFKWGGTGLRIPAGESRTFSVSGKIRAFDNGKLTLRGIIDYIGRTDADQSTYYATADVVKTTGAIEGVVYTDKNRNGQQDPGEAAAGTHVAIGGGVPHVYLTTETGADGHFSFRDVPSGNYSGMYTLADGWIVHTDGADRSVRVEPGSIARLTARAERPYREVLKASVVLDKARYALDEEAKITVTLTNTSDRPISGIQAECTRDALYDDHFGYWPREEVREGWDDLLPPSAGVTVGPGETKTFVATEKVPAAAKLAAKAVVDCDFAPDAVHNADGPRGYDWASVPGGTSVLKGALAHDRNKNYVVDPGEAITNTRLVLRTHRENGADVVDAISDANGNLRLENVPAGEFWAWVDGPWRFEGETGGRVYLFAEQEQTTSFFVVPGELPAPGNGDQGSGGGGTGGALAKTGASVLGLAVVAALLVAFGIGARIAGRRKT